MRRGTWVRRDNRSADYTTNRARSPCGRARTASCGACASAPWSVGHACRPPPGMKRGQPIGQPHRLAHHAQPICITRETVFDGSAWFRVRPILRPLSPTHEKRAAALRQRPCSLVPAPRRLYGPVVRVSELGLSPVIFIAHFVKIYLGALSDISHLWPLLLSMILAN